MQVQSYFCIRWVLDVAWTEVICVQYSSLNYGCSMLFLYTLKVLVTMDVLC